MAGNPNPNMSGLTPFKPGDSGNPVGKTSAQRKLEVDNAERATRIRNKMLLALESDIDNVVLTGIPVMASVTGDMLRLIKDAEDRGLGTAKQSVEIMGEDGGAIAMKVTADAAFAELASLMGGAFARTQSGGDGPDGVA